VALSVALTGGNHEVTASRVSCVATSQSTAIVAGTFTAKPGAISASGLPALSVAPFAKFFDSSGHVIEVFEGPHVKLVSNQNKAFRFQVPMSTGTPASCHVSWTAGPPIVAE
jgi:hypothetical protein